MEDGGRPISPSSILYPPSSFPAPCAGCENLYAKLHFATPLRRVEFARGSFWERGPQAVVPTVRRGAQRGGSKAHETPPEAVSAEGSRNRNPYEPAPE